MSDWTLVKRLRSEVFGGGALELDAADTIDGLQARIRKLEEALRTAAEVMFAHSIGNWEECGALLASASIPHASPSPESKPGDPK